MKKQLYFWGAVLLTGFAQAQDVPDAMRYAQQDLGGSARFRAMSGAFGAVGGDLSAINVNPAGSAVFSRSQVGATFSNYNTTNKSHYFGTSTKDNQIAFDLNQAGGVFVINTARPDSGWNKFTLSLNYDNVNNFDNTFYVAGTNPGRSVADYFLHYANQVGLSGNDYASAYFDQLNLRQRQGYLGYQSYVIDPLGGDGNSTQFVSNVPAGPNRQDQFIETTGYNGKVAINAAGAYRDRFYFGLNLNVYFNDYTRTSSYYEENDNAPIAGRPSIDNITFDNYTHTYGNGFSLQLGAIAKITDGLRAGLSYESPTWYELNDEVWQVVYSNGQNFQNGSDSSITDSDFLIVYDPYRLRTPSKWTGSLAYVFGKSGLISVDYTTKDYGNSRYRPEDSYFGPVNNAISNTLQRAGDLRIGAEYRIKAWSLRGGFRHEDSPYKDGLTMGDLTGFSGGFGYQFTRTRLDLAYSYWQRDTQFGMFNQGLTDPIQNKATNHNLSMSLVFEL